MAQAYLETTNWTDTTGINHIYYLEGDRMLAYIRHGTDEVFWFKKPISISRSGRKFVESDNTPFITQFAPAEDESASPELVEVQGSKGDVYYVNVAEGTCTCPGYTYRGTCRHVKELVGPKED